MGLPVDGRELPESSAELAALLRETSVIGRISPEEKRRVVETLRDEGRYVAMIGDGVNDVPALKAARLAIAQGTGTQMAKSVADVVLVRGDFAAVPAMVEEGRKILRNLQRVTKLFVTKSVFASVLIVSVGLTPTAYPLLPRHLTLAATLTIGVPCLLPCARAELGGLPDRGLPARGGVVLRARGHGSRSRCAVQLPLRAERPRPAAHRGSDRRDDRARRRSACI